MKRSKFTEEQIAYAMGQAEQGTPVPDACRQLGVPGRVVHDLCRTAAREFVEAGVSEGRIMRLCGWKTRAMFDRYNITNQEDLNDAVAQRFNGKQAANKALEAIQVG